MMRTVSTTNRNKPDVCFVRHEHAFPHACHFLGGWVGCLSVCRLTSTHNHALTTEARNTKCATSPSSHTLIFNTSFSLFISKSCTSFLFTFSLSTSVLQPGRSVSEAEPFSVLPSSWNGRTRESQRSLCLPATHLHSNNGHTLSQMPKQTSQHKQNIFGVSNPRGEHSPSSWALYLLKYVQVLVLKEKELSLL